MANYGEKYYHIYCDRYGNTYRVSLRQKDFTGAPKEQDAQPSPWKIERELPSSIKKGAVLGTKATAYFISDTGFTLQELFTAQEDTYQLVHLKNGVITWIGFVVPDGFVQGNWDDGRTSLAVSASDCLSTLTGRPFVDSFGDNYGQVGANMQSFLWVIKEALKKTGLLLPIRTLVDLKNMDQSGNIVREEKIGSFLSRILVDFTGDLPGAQAFKDLVPAGTTLKITTASNVVTNYTVTSSTINTSGVNHSVEMVTTPPYSGPTQNVKIEITSAVAPDPTNTDPLNVTFHDVRVWIKDSNVEGKSYYEVRGGAFNTHEVLNYIAVQWGFIVYQNDGFWEIKRWNVDKGNTAGYRWFNYTSEGVATGRSPYAASKMVPCKGTKDVFRVYGTSLGMDRVFKHAIVNYNYKYKQQGDTLVNMLNNGNMEGVFNPYPRDWTFYNAGNNQNNSVFPPLKVSKVNIGLPDSTFGTFVLGSSIRNYFSNLSQRSVTNVNKGDRLQFTWYERLEGATGNPPSQIRFFGGFAITLYESLEVALADHGVDTGATIRGYKQNYDLVNNTTYKETPPRRQDDPYIMEINMGASWHNPLISTDSRGQVSLTRPHRFVVPEAGFGTRGANVTIWKKVTVVTDPVPMTGVISFAAMGAFTEYFVGIPSLLIPNMDDYSAGIKRVADGSDGSIYAIAKLGTGTEPSIRGVGLTVANITMSRLVDPKNETVPQIDPFMYPSLEDQRTRNYTDTPEEIKVFTGDDYDQRATDRLGSMWFAGKRTSMWDSWDGRFGWSRQGLITAKSLMEMYWKPTRLMTCEIHLPGIKWDTIFEIEELPGLKFAILRGEITAPHQHFKGVLTEIFGVLDEPLPPGGSDGDGTTEPNWVDTGVTRCVKDSNSQNTGDVEGVQRNTNPASTTYGQERWVSLGYNTALCPIGETVDIFWGESIDPHPNLLRYFPFTRVGNIFTVAFNGDDSVKNLRFLHRAALGQVRTISYEDGENSLNAWRYEADITFNGTVYKSLKLDWVVGVFSNLNVNFEIY